MGSVRRIGLFLAIVTLGASFGAVSAWADVISGRVYEEKGAPAGTDPEDVTRYHEGIDTPLADVSVMLINQTDPMVPPQLVQTDAQGQYVFPTVFDEATYAIILPSLASVPLDPPDEDPDVEYEAREVWVTRSVIVPPPANPPTIMTSTTKEDTMPVPTQTPAPMVMSTGAPTPPQGADFPVIRQRSEGEFAFVVVPGSRDVFGFAFIDGRGKCDGVYSVQNGDTVAPEGTTVRIMYMEGGQMKEATTTTTALMTEENDPDDDSDSFEYNFRFTDILPDPSTVPTFTMTSFFVKLEPADGRESQTLKVDAVVLEAVDPNPAPWAYILPLIGGCDTGSYSGTVYEDTNGNGMLDPGEELDAVPVTLLGADGNPVGTEQMTNAQGEFTFGDLEIGEYRVRANLQAPPSTAFSNWIPVQGEDVTGDVVFTTGPTPPVADAGGPYMANTGEEITFDGSGSTDAASYAWDFGDGNVGTGQSPKHTYDKADVYTVTLIVTGPGGTDTDTATATVTLPPNQAPTADPGGPYMGVAGQPVTFDGSGSSDPDGGTIEKYEWDFGDGNTGMGVKPTHTYDDGGMYVVKLKVTDDRDGTDTKSTMAMIADRPNPPPTADAGGPYMGNVGQPVMLDGSGSSDDGTIASYMWDFGDGNFGSGVTPTHTWTTPGMYTVKLTVMDDGGKTDDDTTSAEITIVVDPAPTADAGGPYAADAGDPILFDGTGSSAAPGRMIASYAWDFGDGNMGSGPRPTHTYTTAGNYTASLTVTDDRGNTGTDTAPVRIEEGGGGGEPDICIKFFYATPHVKQGRYSRVRFRTWLRNSGTGDGTAKATLIGTQRGKEVYREVREVEVPAGCRCKSVRFPSHTPRKAGRIYWTLEVGDCDAQRTTRVKPKRKRDVCKCDCDKSKKSDKSSKSGKSKKSGSSKSGSSKSGSSKSGSSKSGSSKSKKSSKGHYRKKKGKHSWWQSKWKWSYSYKARWRR